MMKNKRNRKFDPGVLLRRSFRLPRMSKAKDFWTAFRSRAELIPQNRENRKSSASDQTTKMTQWRFSKVAAGLLILFALYTFIENYFFDPSPDHEPIEVAKEEISPEPSPDLPILYEDEMNKEEPADPRDEQRPRREEESPDEMFRRELREPQPQPEMEALKRAEPAAEKKAPELGLDVLSPGPAEVKELRIRLISLHEAEEKTSEEKLSDLLPLLIRDYDRQAYRVETEKSFKPEPGKSVKLGGGFTLTIEDIDGAEVILHLRGRRTTEEKKKDPLQKNLQIPLSQPLIIGPFQGWTEKNYLLALTADE